jgi:hypothetical protein
LIGVAAWITLYEVRICFELLRRCRHQGAYCGNYEMVEALTARLREFASNQVSVAEPGNPANLQRQENASLLSTATGTLSRQAGAAPPEAASSDSNDDDPRK